MSDRPLLVLASRNAKKARELADLLATHGIQVRSVLDYPTAPEVEETGTTFGENACLKAATVASSLGEWTIADDSGLMVDALGGDPGVRSARYAGEQATDEKNNQRLLQELQAVPAARRGRAVCLCFGRRRCHGDHPTASGRPLSRPDADRVARRRRFRLRSALPHPRVSPHIW